MNITISAARSFSEASFVGMETRGLRDLLAWTVAHPDPDAMIADQAVLEARLTALGPVFASLTSTGVVDGITVETPVGLVSVAHAGFAVSATGLVVVGMLREQFLLQRLTLPAGLVPDWAVALVPDQMRFDFALNDFDAAAAAGLLIPALDLAAAEPVPPEMGPELLAALLPHGMATFSTEGTGVGNGLHDLDLKGRLRVGPDTITPQVSAVVTAKGLDAAMETLQSAPSELLTQINPVLLAARGMGQAGADGSPTWAIEMGTDGVVTINGVDPTAMMGGD